MQSGLHYSKKGQLHFANQEIASLADRFSTPLYVYSADLIQGSLLALQESLAEIKHLVCYSVKANSNLSILRLIGNCKGGVDIVSGGELYRAQKSNIPANRIVFSGTGKTAQELEMALRAGILLFSVESEQELLLLAALAQKMQVVAKVSLRINPAIEADTHPYISTGRKGDKFGISYGQVLPLYERVRNIKSICICGLACHIGSQITDLMAFRSAARALLDLTKLLGSRGFCLQYLDLGGGLGISYQEEKPPTIQSYVQTILDELSSILRENKVTLILEPGRSIVGMAGILVTKLLFIKNNGHKNFYIVDAAMNDLMRPALYQAHHPIWSHLNTRESGPEVDLVGPICETGDFFARNIKLPLLETGDYVVIGCTGAYGFSMSSNYNSRSRAAEVLIQDGTARLIRRRESYADLVRLEELNVEAV